MNPNRDEILHEKIDALTREFSEFRGYLTGALPAVATKEDLHQHTQHCPNKVPANLLKKMTAALATAVGALGAAIYWLISK